MDYCQNRQQHPPVLLPPPMANGKSVSSSSLSYLSTDLLLKISEKSHRKELRRRRKEYIRVTRSCNKIMPVHSRIVLLLGLWLVLDFGRFDIVHAFVRTTTPKSLAIWEQNHSKSSISSIDTRVKNRRHDRIVFLSSIKKQPPMTPTVSTTTSVALVPEIAIEAAASQTPQLANYATAATSLFNNMKLPAAVVTAGMISLGFATGFPELPQVSPTNGKEFPDYLRARCEALKRLHIVVALISVTSELVVVLWAAVEVNQLTEKQYAPAMSVWDLIQRDADLAWSAVNSHFVLGIIGFVTMLALRAYVMLLAAEASSSLMMAASTGTGAALCLMISIVNRGVESGGGDGYRYGNTIFDLFEHYAVLLAQAATDNLSPGPLQFLAILLEISSLVFMANVLLFQKGKMDYDDVVLGEEEQDEINVRGTITRTILDEDDEECPVIDIVEAYSPRNGAPQTSDGSSSKSVRVVVDKSSGGREPFFARCLDIDEELLESNNNKKNNTKQQTRKEIDDKKDRGDTSVSIY